MKTIFKLDNPEDHSWFGFGAPRYNSDEVYVFYLEGTIRIILEVLVNSSQMNIWKDNPKEWSVIEWEYLEEDLKEENYKVLDLVTLLTHPNEKFREWVKTTLTKEDKC